MVNFKQGSQAEIDALSSFENGTFYITLDTHRVYLGTSSGKILLQQSMTFSTEEPTSSDGENGDLWFVYAE